MALGNRGNIDQAETDGLRNRVAALNTGSAAASLGLAPAKGLAGTAPGLAAVRSGRASSLTSPMFSNTAYQGTRRTGQAALTQMNALY